VLQENGFQQVIVPSLGQELNLLSREGDQ
jgi:hypothetical protein